VVLLDIGYKALVCIHSYIRNIHTLPRIQILDTVHHNDKASALRAG